jgi:predicted DsbA family dithiol-disulfide isomerase
MQIDVYSDMVCPWCRIGKKNLGDALDKWETDETVNVRFRAFQLDPMLPEEGLPFHKVMEEKMGGRLEQMLEQVTNSGAAVLSDLKLHFQCIVVLRAVNLTIAANPMGPDLSLTIRFTAVFTIDRIPLNSFQFWRHLPSPSSVLSL